MQALDELEAELLRLGSSEQRIVETIKLLKQTCRQFGQSGQYSAADELYAHILTAEKALALLKEQILKIEQRLYPARLR